MVGRTAGRHIDRPRARYRLSAMYIIYDTECTELPTCRPISHLILNIDKPLCMFIQDERWVGGSAGRQIDRAITKYRLTSKYIKYVRHLDR